MPPGIQPPRAAMAAQAAALAPAGVEKFQNFFYSLEEIVIPAVRHGCVFFPCAQTSFWRVFWMSRVARQDGPRKTPSGATPVSFNLVAARPAARLPSTRRSAGCR